MARFRRLHGAIDVINNDVGGGGGSSSSIICCTMKQLVRKAASDDVDARMPMRAGTCHAASCPLTHKQRAAGGGAGSHDVAWHHRHYASLQHNVGGRHALHFTVRTMGAGCTEQHDRRCLSHLEAAETFDHRRGDYCPRACNACYTLTRVALPYTSAAAASVSHPPAKKPEAMAPQGTPSMSRINNAPVCAVARRRG
jgi:hypothetical protein